MGVPGVRCSYVYRAVVYTCTVYPRAHRYQHTRTHPVMPYTHIPGFTGQWVPNARVSGCPMHVSVGVPNVRVSGCTKCTGRRVIGVPNVRVIGVPNVRVIGCTSGGQLGVPVVVNICTLIGVHLVHYLVIIGAFWSIIRSLLVHFGPLMGYYCPEMTSFSMKMTLFPSK